MAAKTFYLVNSAGPGTTSGSLQDGGSAPTTATTGTGWTVGTGSTNYARMAYGSKVASGSFATGPYPNTTFTLAASWQSQNTINGSFAAGTWTFNIPVIAVTAGGAQSGAAYVRVWRSANANGSSGTQITTASVTLSTVTSLSTSTQQISTGTVSMAAATLTNEYLFIEIAWRRTVAGGGTTADVVIRVGSAGTVVTTEYTPARTVAGSLYVGSGGSDSNDGLSWAGRKLTVQAAVTAATVAGDSVYVAPGTYAETVTLIAGGSAGTVKSLIGDVTGVNTSGTSGIVRITGSNNNQTATRTNALVASARSYWTIQGISFDSTTNVLATFTNCTNFIIRKCFFADTPFWVGAIAFGTVGESANNLVQQCWFLGTDGVNFTSGSPLNCACVVESCFFLGSGMLHVQSEGGVTMRNCTGMGGTDDNMVTLAAALTTGATKVTIRNCLICCGWIHLQDASAAAWVDEDYNCLFAPGNVARSSVATGSHSISSPPLLTTPKLLGNGTIDAAWIAWQPQPASKLIGAGTSGNSATADLYGRTISGTPDIGAVLH